LVCTLSPAPLGRHPLREFGSDLGQALHDLMLFVRGFFQHWLRR
jgi:hypothetical protein